MHVDAFSLPVDTRAPTGQTNAYLVESTSEGNVGRPDGDTSGDGDAAWSDAAGTLLVDPASRSESLDAVVREKGIDHVAVTHAHPDHVGAVADYAAETGATVWARRGYSDRFAAAAGVEPDRTFVEGDRVGPARVFDAAGHAPDHVAFETPRGVLAGDLAVAEGSVAVAAPEGDVRAYLTSLRRIVARDPRTLFPGHGPAVDDPRATCERLIEHRLAREARILDAVRDGASDLDAVLARAYDKDLTGVRDLARATTVAHLEKLDRQTSVRWEPDRERVEPV